MSLHDIIARDLEKVFFAGTGFDQPVTVKPRYGTERTINAIIDRTYAEQYGVESYMLLMRARTVDVADCRQGDRITYSGTQYTIKSPIQHDEYGLSICEITREVTGG